ncbi:hypothetical protein ZWY2020_054626 [Hordeum vulgare]|nr:hypothetical protein ZWY2020_054626 [Hordeum vulgare]
MKCVEPSNDLSKIRWEILTSGEPLTLRLTYIWCADTPARITGDGYNNGGELKSTRRHSWMNVDPSSGDNHFGHGRGGDTSLS